MANTERRSAERPARRGFPWPPGYIVLWALTLISLVMNFLMLRQLLLARQIARQSVHDSIAVIESLQTQVITYNVVVDQNLPLASNIPIQTTLDIQLDEDFPIDTTVTVSVPTPLGDFPVSIPIHTVVPVHRTVNVNVDDEFALDTVIPVYFEVPISIAVADTPLFATLEETKTRLVLLEESLNAPLLPGFGSDEPVTPAAPTLTPTPVEPGVTTTP